MMATSLLFCSYTADPKMWQHLSRSHVVKGILLRLTIACHVICGRGNLLHKGGSHVLVVILELNRLGHCDTILGDFGSSIRLLNDYIASLCSNVP